MLIGRAAEKAAITAVLAAASEGDATGLILRGEPGAGRTSLLDEAALTSKQLGFTSLTAVARPTDAGTAFTGLASLLRTLEARFPTLPDSQRTALEVALGISSCTTEAHEVGRAVHRLLGEVAEEHPLLVSIDNVAWLDESSLRAMSYATARFVAEPIAFIMTSEPEWQTPREWYGIVREVHLGRMTKSELSSLVHHSRVDDLSDDVLEACIKRTDSNPLGLLELVKSLSEREIRGLSPIPTIPKPSDAITRGFGKRISELDRAARRALVVVAADDSGDLSIIESALRLLGEPATGLDLAEKASIIEVNGANVRFTSELLRAVAYHQVERKSRQAAHRALGTVLDRPQDAEARTRHLAAAADGQNAIVADALELVAGKAARRGAAAEAATVFSQSAALTPDTTIRDSRVLNAARQWIAAGQPQMAIPILAALNVAPALDAARMTLLVTATALVEGSTQAGILVAKYAIDQAQNTGANPGVQGSEAAEIHWLLLALAADEYRRAGLHDRCEFALGELVLAQGWPRSMREALLGNPDASDASIDHAFPGRDLLERRLIVRVCESLLASHRYADAANMSKEIAFSADPIDAYVLEIAGIQARAAIGADPSASSAVTVAFATLIEAATGAPQFAKSAAESLLKTFDAAPIIARDAGLDDPLTALTKAERRVADAVGEGRTNREAAESLFLSVKTIDFHLQQIYRKLELRSRAELAILVTRSAGALR